MRWWLVGAAAGCAGDVKDTDDYGGDPPIDPTWDETTDASDGLPCAPAPGDAGSVPVLPECAGDGATVQDPWLATVEWTYTDGGETVVSPVTGQLTDDNGDGAIDDLDVPDVAFTSYTDGNLYVVSGDGAGLVCSSPGWDPDGGVIVADVDGDGLNEVVGAVDGGRIQAVDGACHVEWTTTEAYDLDYVVTTAADLGADGVVEVISSVAVVDGRTGAPVVTLAPEDASCQLRAPFTGDFDQDGLLEIMLGNTVFSSAGEPLWSAPGSGTSCFGGVANLDDDPEGEIFLSYGFELGVYEHDGTPIWSAPLGMPNPGPPCAGDIDGDGAVEVVAPNGLWLTAFEADGTEKWSVRIDDNSGSAACSVFDLDGDGVYEVLHADEEVMRVYDGGTGAVRFRSGTHRSVTYFEAPTVVDLDRDGAAEIVIASSSFPLDVEGGITVLGHGGAGWPPAGSTWGLHDFSGTNQLPDGRIPQEPATPWLQHNLFRGQPSEAVPGAPNLVGEVTGVCATSCEPDGVVTVSAQVANDGGASTEATLVSLSTVDGTIERLVGTAEVPPASAGDVVPSVVFEVPVADWTGEYVLRVDGDGVVGECHEDDNEVRGTADVCN